MNRPGAVLGVLALVVLGCADAASAQTRDARADAVGTSAIAGTVVSDDAEARPVRRVRVTCAGQDYGATAITDDRGRFVFPGLGAGRYTIQAAKDAWIPTAYGAKRPMRPGSAIPLADRQQVEIVVRLLRGSVITGVVLDHSNQPAADTVVNAMRFVTQNGERRLVATESAGVADDRGVYRIYGLPPGEYVLAAVAKGAARMVNAPSSELRLIGEKGGGERTVALASTFYPGTSIASQAVAIPLGRAEERTGIDFALQLVPTARVDGSVMLPDGSTAPAGTQVSLLASAAAIPGLPLQGMRSTQVGADGAFSFTDVSPGLYTVVARATVPASSSSAAPVITWASSDIAVDGEPVAGVSLGLQPGLTLTGQLRFDGTRLKPPADLKSVRVTLQPVQAQGTVSFAPPAATVHADGGFVLSGITPGPYRLAASFQGSGRPGGWQLRSAIVNGHDTLDQPFTVHPSQSIAGVSVTFADRLAELTGTVHNAAGGAPNEFTVILFSADQTHWLPRSRRIQGVRPSADGAFAFRGLPAGAYYLAAIDDVEPGEWFDRTLLQRLMPSALRLTLGEGEQKAQDIRLGGA